MHAHSNLYQLVRSLSRYEKGFCHKYLASRPGKKKEVSLAFFKMLSEQDSYDEEQLRRHFSKGKSKSHFSVLKNNLFHQLLEALAQFHEKNSELAEFFKVLRGIEILNLRGLFKACLKQIQKAHKMLPAEGYTEERLLLHKIQRRILRSNITSSPQQIQELANQSSGLLSTLGEKLKGWEGFNQAFELYMQTGQRPNALHLAESERLLQKIQSSPAPQSPEARLLNIEIQLRCHVLQGNRRLIFEDGLAMLNEMESFPDRIQWEWHAYFHALILVINGAVQERDFVYCLQLIVRAYNSIPGFKLTPPASFRRVGRALLNFELTCWARLGRPDRGIQRMESYPRPLLRYQDRLTDAAALSIYSNAAWIYLLNGQFSLAFQYSRTALNIPYRESHFGEFHKIRVLHMVILYHLQDWSLLESSIASFRKFVQSRRETNAYDRLLTQTFSKLLSQAPRQKETEQLHQIIVDLEALKKQDDPIESAGVQYFPLTLWLQSLIGPLSFAEASRQVYRAPDTALEQAIQAIETSEI